MMLELVERFHYKLDLKTRKQNIRLEMNVISDINFAFTKDELVLFVIYV